MRPGCILLALCALAACKRETRDLRTDPPVQAALDGVRLLPAGVTGAPPAVIWAQGEPYEGNAWQINQGKRLYEWFNCTGCHAQGGGLSGPALTNDWWRYGPDPVTVFVTIRDGRPNGMPAFRDRMTTDQIWQLTGYIRTLGAYRAQTSAPSRNDSMHARPAENRAPAGSDISMPPSHP